MPYAVATRDEDAIVPYASALAPLGYEVVAMPVTRTAPPHDPDALSRAASADPAVVVIASARAAEAYASARAASDSKHVSAEVWAVGPATARALAAAGIAARGPEGARDGATLAHAIVAARDVRDVRILVPRAEGGRDEAIDILRAAGAIVDDVIAYRTLAIDATEPAMQRGARLLDDETNLCLVFAPSQVAALDAIRSIASVRAGFVAIGETTANALRERAASRIAVAEQPTPEGIANAVRAVYLGTR